jgi:hypothetical protein
VKSVFSFQFGGSIPNEPLEVRHVKCGLEVEHELPTNSVSNIVYILTVKNMIQCGTFEVIPDKFNWNMCK